MAEVVIAPVRFTRKPMHVEAIEVTEANFALVAMWCRGLIETRDGSAADGINPSEQLIRLRGKDSPVERHTKAVVGDYVVRVSRSFKVYTRDAFINSFEPEALSR